MKTATSLQNLVLLLCVTCALFACPRKPSTTTDSGMGEPDASVEEMDGGDEPVDAGPQEPVDAGPPPELKVTRVLPPRGPTPGGSNVIIEGSGFLRDFATSGSQAKKVTTIKFGSNAVIDFTIIDDQTLEARVPPGVPGTSAVSIQNPNGNRSCGNCYTYFDELVMTSVTPKTGPLAGGNEVVIDGQGFSQDVQVLFGGQSAPQITFVSSKQLKVIAPRGLVTDAVDVSVYNKNGVSTQRRIYRYAAPLQVTSVAPLTGELAGGTTVTLIGSGFTSVTQVKFGANDGTSLHITSDTTLEIVTPAATAAGAVDVTLVSGTDSLVLKSAFAYVDSAGAFAAFGVFPHVLREGKSVTILGQGLDASGLTVSFGGRAATIESQSFSTAVVKVPSRGSSPRITDAVITGPSPVTLAHAVTWGIRLSSVTPSSAPAAGGASLSLVGESIPTGATLRVGALPATAVMVVSETSITGVSPAASGGAPNDLLVSDPADQENQAVLERALTILEPLSVGRVQPDRGAIAGNTLVTVLGAGFGDSTVVTFGTNKAKDIKVVDSHTITCRTPKGNVGTVDVLVDRLTERDVLPGGFSFFDPRSISGGSSGGPLVGTLNVTVLDGTSTSYGAPIPLATVVLGIDPTSPFIGTTDSRGQVTFSDPALVKAQTVTVYKDQFQSTTVTQVNSENLTVYVTRTGGGEPSPSNGSPNGVPASMISGKVTGFKSPRLLSTTTESLEARVFVADTSIYNSAPFRGGPPTRQGEKWQIVKEGGEYLVYTNAGLHAVYAVLGISNTTLGTFEPVLMGVKRSVTTSPDLPATNAHIVLDMQLDLTVPITVDAPLTFPTALGPVPAVNSIYSWLDLGAEGFIPNPNNWNSGTGSSSSIVTTGTSISFPHFPQLDGSNFIYMNEASSPALNPTSYYFRRQPGDMSKGVTIGPLLPAPNIIAPNGVFTGAISWTIDPGVVPNMYNVQILRQTLFGPINVWDVMLPGTETGVVLPDAAVEKLLREEKGNTLFIVIYGTRTPKFSYSQWTYDLLSPLTWSSFTISVSATFTP